MTLSPATLVRALAAVLLATAALHAADFNVTTPGDAFNYTIDGTSGNPTLTLERGRTYTFLIDTCSCHPFEIRGAPNGTVTNNNISQGTITFAVPATATNYSYRCSIHLFSGTINTVAPAAPPTVVTSAPGLTSNLTTTAATLRGTVNPNGQATTAMFLYDTDSSLAAPSTLVVGQSVGSGSSVVAVSANLTGLLEDTVYFFRLKATNGSGTSEGSIQSFRTLSTDPSLTALSVDGVTLSPAFDANTLAYTASVTGAVTTAVLQATAKDSRATITLPGGGSVPLDAGDNVITIGVTASDKVTKRTYTLTISRTAPEIAVERTDTSALADGLSTLVFPAPAPVTGSSQSIVIRNVGTEPLTGIAASIDGLNATDFSIATTPPITLAAGAQTTLQLNFTTTAIGNRTATLHITSSDSNESPFDIALLGRTHTVNFESHTVSQREDAVTLRLPVRISSALGRAWSLPFSVTPAFASDFTVSASPLKFTATQTVAYISVTVKEDSVIEGSETFTFALGTPSDAAVGLEDTTLTASTVDFSAKLDLTIVEDDVLPVIAPPLASRIVALGDPVSFTTAATGSAPLTTSWRRNNVTLPGEVGTTLTVASAAALGDATSYTFAAANQRGTVTSTAQLAVVDRAARSVRANAGTSPQLTAFAGGNSLTYQWRLNGADISTTDPKYSGVRTKTLTIKSVQTTESGRLYSCMVTAPGGALATGDYELQVPVNKPIAQTPAVPDLVIYNALSYQLPFDTDPSAAPTKFVCTGLPTGLTCSSTTGIITGKPTKTGSFTITVTLSNSSGPADATVQDTFEVKAFPTGALGSYTAYFDRDARTNDNLGGRIDLTTTTAGGFTGTLWLGNLKWTLKSSLQTSGTLNAHPGTTLALARTGRLPLRLTLDLDPSADSFTATVIESGAATGSLATGWRNVWHTTAPANPVTAQLGTHSFQMDPPVSGPMGYGYGTIKITNTGVTTVAGRTADGGTISTTSLLSPTADVPVFTLLYGGKGSILGHLAIAADPAHTTQGTLHWQKLTATTARDYAPFGPHSVSVHGGLHTVAAPALGLATGHYLFSDGGVGLSATTPNVPVTISTLNKLTIGTPNPGTVTSLTFSASTGSFTGRFVLKDPPAAPRTVTFQGQLVPALSQGYGYFLLPQLADPAAIPPTTATTSPILSGKVVLGP